MESVRVDLGARSYDVIIGQGILDEVGTRIRELDFSSLAVVSNPTVFGLYGSRVANSLRLSGLAAHVIIIPDGEQFKDFMWANYVLGEMLGRKLDRRSAVIALGGGVVGDLACFAASIYMRGIACVQIPTTLLSQVDSSVGGKTGVNHIMGKNMIGTFHQPSLVLADTGALKTLPSREFMAGVAEIIKYGVIRDAELFAYLQRHLGSITALDDESLSFIVRRSCEIKAEVVARDERESGVRQILNFGHTFGHAVESLTGYTKFLHGEAVAIGMCHAAALAADLEQIDRGVVEEICGLISRFRLPCCIPDSMEPHQVIEVMRRDKKTISGRMRLVLPERIGSVRVCDDVAEDRVLGALRFRPANE
ncbi:MAG: 3-dehydroquinate synthase [Thermodesulfovibrionales bacterium]